MGKQTDILSGGGIKVPGNSGCLVDIVFLDQHIAVRKSACSPEYAIRLHNQRIKQESFCCNIQGLRVPKIIQHDEMSFTMEYLPMLDCIEFFERATPNVIKSRIETLIKLVTWELNSAVITVVDGDKFRKKLVDIQMSVPVNIWEQWYSNYAADVQGMLLNPVELPLGQCHGDLTMSNVMFSIEDECVGIIDFLDSYIESPVVDIVKLRQDTRYHWTNRRYLREHDHGKVSIVNRWIDAIITQSFHDLIVSRAFWLLEMMNYLRIAPYVHTEEEHRYLSRVMAEIVSIKEDVLCG